MVWYVNLIFFILSSSRCTDWLQAEISGIERTSLLHKLSKYQTMVTESIQIKHKNQIKLYILFFTSVSNYGLDWAATRGWNVDVRRNIHDKCLGGHTAILPKVGKWIAPHPSRSGLAGCHECHDMPGFYTALHYCHWYTDTYRWHHIGMYILFIVYFLVVSWGCLEQRYHPMFYPCWWYGWQHS